MDASIAVERVLSTGRKRSTAVRSVGYAALIQSLGWEGIEEQMPPEAVAGLRCGFEEAGVDPTQIEFANGRTEYLEEVVRSSRHPASAEAARRLLGKG